MLLEELILILVLVLLNGYFAAMEMALVTSRRHRLKTLANLGKRGAKEVLHIKERPGHFLATVQVGIPLLASFASAFGGAEPAPHIAQGLRSVPWLAPYADQIALVLIVLAITYLSLVLGELVPKQLALRNPEGISTALFRPVQLLGKIASLPIRLLSFSADLVAGLIGPGRARRPSTSSEEIELLIEQGTAEGIFQISEGAFVSGVFEYADRQAQGGMTPRP